MNNNNRITQILLKKDTDTYAGVKELDEAASTDPVLINEAAGSGKYQINYYVDKKKDAKPMLTDAGKIFKSIISKDKDISVSLTPVRYDEQGNDGLASAHIFFVLKPKNSKLSYVGQLDGVITFQKHSTSLNDNLFSLQIRVNSRNNSDARDALLANNKVKKYRMGSAQGIVIFDDLKVDKDIELVSYAISTTFTEIFLWNI